MTIAAKSLFISHGGGPMPLLGDIGHRDMVALLTRLPSLITRPKAIVVVSAHWEEPVATLTTAPDPQLIYDYYGFPEESYHIHYPCPGHPELARQVQQLLSKAGFDAETDDSRGYDHGLFIPLKIMYPQADIPCIQLSLVRDLDPARHIAMGRALGSLAEQGLMIIGSGFSFHNIREFFSSESTDSHDLNQSFERWLIDTCSNENYSEEQRTDRLLAWSEVRGARYCHPREEHLIPLMVCYGAAQSACRKHYELSILNKMSSMYLW